MHVRRVLVPTAAMLWLLWVAPSVDAAGSNILSTAATVAGTCKVIAAPGVLDFGTIDSTAASDAAASTTFLIKCTKGTASAAASDDGGLYFAAGRRMRHSVNATTFLPYAVSYSGDAGFVGAGFGSAAPSQLVRITGAITPAQFQNAFVTAVGQVYVDTVTITVNP